MVTAILSGGLDNWDQVESDTEPFFGLEVPIHIDGVPDEVLRPRDTWTDGTKYDQQAEKLVDMFGENFKQFESNVSEEVRDVGPSAR
jgi:phosphoenolpyruvate carboxykinase (ATP)